MAQIRLLVLQKPTVLLVNVALGGCICALACLLVISLNSIPALTIHVVVLLFLACSLLFLFNWCALALNSCPTQPCPHRSHDGPPVLGLQPPVPLQLVCSGLDLPNQQPLDQAEAACLTFAWASLVHPG